MDGGSNNLNNEAGDERFDEPRFEPPIPPRSPARRPSPLTHGGPPPPLPRTPTRDERAGVYGNAPSSAGASFAPHQQTPGTIPSVGSAGTVVRRRDFAGDVPVGYFSQFPPEDRSRTLSHPSSDGSRPRSRSEPTSPSRVRVSAVDDSFVTSGSPVSPVSPEHEADTPPARTDRAGARARLDHHLDPPSSSPAASSPNVQVLGASSSPNVETFGSSPPERTPTRPFSIPRRPVARPQAQRWQTAMSTILSDSGSELGRPRSPTPARFSRASDTTRSSSAAIDFARLSSPFPLPEPLFAARESRVASQATPSPAIETPTRLPPTNAPAARPPPTEPTIRPIAADDLDRDLPPLPLQPGTSNSSSRPSSNEHPVLPIQSPDPASSDRRSSSLYSKPEYRDSGVQTSRRGSLFQDSLPAWARYFMTHPLSRPPSGDYASTDSLFFSALSEKYESMRHDSSARRTDSGWLPPRKYSDALRTDSGAGPRSGSTAPRTDSAARSGSSAAHIGRLDAGVAAVPGRRQPRAVVDPADLPDFFSPSKDFEIPVPSTNRNPRAYYASVAADRPRTPTVEPPTPAPASSRAYATSPALSPHPSPNLRRRSSRAGAGAHPRRHTVSSTHAPDPYPPRDSLRPPPHPRPAPPRRPTPSQRARDAITPAPAPHPSSSSDSRGPNRPRHATVSAQLDRRAARPPPHLESGDATQWSPHLYHARHSVVHRRSLFRAPSLDERAEGTGLSRRNLQVWAFALGFVFPVAWVVAALMPLPHRPRTPPESPRFEHDLEKTLGPADLARYENARWWRVINRVMSVVGVGIIIAIVSGVFLRSDERMLTYRRSFWRWSVREVLDLPWRSRHVTTLLLPDRVSFRLTVWARDARPLRRFPAPLCHGADQPHAASAALSYVFTSTTQKFVYDFSRSACR